MFCLHSKGLCYIIMGWLWTYFEMNRPTSFQFIQFCTANSMDSCTAMWVITVESLVQLAHNASLYRHFLVPMCPCLHGCATPIKSRHMHRPDPRFVLHNRETLVINTHQKLVNF